MASKSVRDEWILPTLEGLLPKESVAQMVTGLQENSYWETAVKRQLISEDDILSALAQRFRMKVANLATVSQQAKELVPEALARKYRIVPLAITDSVLDIATADPHDLDCEKTLAFALGRTVRMSLASPLRLAERIDEIYRPENAVEKILENVTNKYELESISDEITQDDLDLSPDRAAERPVIRLVDHIVAEGIASRASDIHLEPEEGGVAVRYRIDGVLRQVMSLPRAAGIPLVSRIKIMSGLDIADRLRPQDGRARVAVSGVRIDLRVSTLPASNGEKVVIRILDQRATVLSLDAMGMNADELERIRSLTNTREGIVLVTGPTGSGKTTTLYSMIRAIQQRGVNIVTIEDPVEYRLQGIVQVQVNEKAGLNYASALKSILRQDPDVVLIGEIRDREAAQIAVQASLTGHLVLSTLHTIDASSSVTRLVDVGIETYKIATALKGILAQRLLRRLCLSCREAAVDVVPERARRYFDQGQSLYRGVGCPECAMTGYRGRLAIAEVLLVTPEVERRISNGESADRIAEAARDGGMRSLFESGLQHVKAGTTSIEELLRVCEVPIEGGRISQAIRTVDLPPPPMPRTSGAQSTVEPPGGPISNVPIATPAPAERRRDSGATPIHSPAIPPVRMPSVPIRGSARSTPASGTGVVPDASFELLEDTPVNGKSPLVTTVLLVEDEEPLRRVVKDLLEREGFQVTEAGDGVAALDEIDRSAPDIVVLDLNLPRLDGYAVLTHIRARPATASLPVLVLTAKGDEDSEVRVFEFGADDFLTKPFRPRALSARLHALLKRG
ncbi:MAG: type II/IV secretion system protein [Gemmatimonadetes bacterium]|nr:type II/IV secretion system protein [Gemmatimonadota bacterium]